MKIENLSLDGCQGNKDKYLPLKTAAETFKLFINDTKSFFGYQLHFQIRYDKGVQTVGRRNPSVH